MSERRIGSVSFGGGSLRAEMFAGGTFRVSAAGHELPSMSRAWKVLWDTEGYGPQDGPYGAKFLYQMAEKLNGVVVMEPQEESVHHGGHSD